MVFLFDCTMGFFVGRMVLRDHILLTFAFGVLVVVLAGYTKVFLGKDRRLVALFLV